MKRSAQRKWNMLVLAAALVASAELASAADVNTILTKMRRAVAPGEDMRAKATFTMTNAHGEDVQWTGRLYQRAGLDPRVRIVLEHPLDLRGTDVTVVRAADGGSRARVYLPAIRRVRQISGDMRGESFLGTDFDYEDLGFQQIEYQQHTVLDDAELDGRDCYRVESRPDSGWWYGRIVRWIDKRDFLPRRTDYYDRQDVLWKVRTLENVRTIASHPTWTRLVMKTVPTGTATSIALADVEYDTGLSPTLFEEP